jgi:hypothetical protein
MMATSDDNYGHSPPMSPPAANYSSFLLRVWRMRRDETSHWRLVLMSTASGQEWHFFSLDALAGFLNDPAWPPADGSGEETVAGSASQT